MARIALIICDACGSDIARLSPDQEIDRFESLELRAAREGWERKTFIPSQGERDYCPRCLNAIRGACNELTRGEAMKLPRPTIEPMRPYRVRGGFTLIEMLVVLGIFAVVSVAALPTVLDLRADRGPRQGAATVQAAIVAAQELAVRDGAAGVRLVPDPAWRIERIAATGRLDPAAPIAYSTILPLVQPPHYEAGRVSVHLEGYPPWMFSPLPGRLMLEESPFDADGDRCEPTTWAWNVRVGDVVQYLGRSYTVTGPTAIPIGADNPQGFVNFGTSGAKPPLVRTFPVPRSNPPATIDVAVEWLYLTNQVDDDGDGFTDEGWDGLDNDLDGPADEDDEWEAEAWGVGATVTPSPYRIVRRPIAGDSARVTMLPAPVVIDATGWSQAGRRADGADARLRSQVPVDPYTGVVDLMFDSSSRATIPSLYGRPAATPYRRDWVHLWIAERADVLAPTVVLDADGVASYALPATARRAAVVSLHRETGRVHAIAVDDFDPPATFLASEGGVR